MLLLLLSPALTLAALVMPVIGPLLWALGMEPRTVLLGALGGAVVIVKTLPDWNRKYD